MEGTSTVDVSVDVVVLVDLLVDLLVHVLVLVDVAGFATPLPAAVHYNGLPKPHRLGIEFRH